MFVRSALTYQEWLEYQLRLCPTGLGLVDACVTAVGAVSVERAEGAYDRHVAVCGKCAAADAVAMEQMNPTDHYAKLLPGK